MLRKSLMVFLLCVVTTPFAGAYTPDDQDRAAVAELGLSLHARHADGVLVLRLEGACYYDVKMVQVHPFEERIGSPWSPKSGKTDSWRLHTRATEGVFTAIVCTGTSCVPIAIAFDAEVWSGETPTRAWPQNLLLVFIAGLVLLFCVVSFIFLKGAPRD